MSIQAPTAAPLLRAWTVSGALTGGRCADYIAAATSQEWRGSAVTEDNAPSRRVSNAEQAIDAAELFANIRPHLPASIYGLRLLAIPTERMMFLRYRAGEYFGMHTDAVFQPAAGQRSLFTMLVYLNDDFVGGETHFPDLPLVAKPEAGAALIIPHGLRHEGLKIRAGVKYALHSYIVYGRR